MVTAGYYTSQLETQFTSEDCSVKTLDALKL